MSFNRSEEDIQKYIDDTKKAYAVLGPDIDSWEDGYLQALLVFEEWLHQ